MDGLLVRKCGPCPVRRDSRDDVDVDLAAVSDDVVEKGRLEEFAPPRVGRLADDDLRDVSLASVTYGLRGRVVAAQDDGVAVERLDEAHVLGKSRAVARRHAHGGRRLHVDADKLRVQAARHPPRRAHEMRGVRAGRHADEHALARMPRLIDSVCGLVAAHLRVDALGRPAQRELAKRDEVAFLEEVFDGVRGLLREIHLAFVQPLIDDADFVSLVEDRVGDGLADDDASDLRDDVVETLEVLDVERRHHVDARVEQLVDVLPPLEVPRARSVRMRELVDENHPGSPLEGRVQIELLELDASMLDRAAGQQLEPYEQ